MPIPDGHLRLHWDDKEGVHLYQDFPCLDDALNHSAVIHGRGLTLTRLENCMREDATPVDQLRAVAKMRCNDMIRRAFARVEQERLEAIPGYGSF